MAVIKNLESNRLKKMRVYLNLRMYQNHLEKEKY